MANVMILGAGIYQLPLILTAKRLGHRVVVVSYGGNYPGFALADEACYLDTTDAQGVLAAARAHRIDAITTTGTDVAVPTIAHVCDALGLPGISPATASRVTDKAAMKAAFEEGGVATSAFEVARSLDESLEAAERLGYPIMVKACDVSGSRGITKAESPRELAGAYEEARRVTRAGHVVVEEYIEGVDFGMELFVSDGELVFCAVHDKFIQEVGGVAVSVGHAFPYSGGPSVFAAAEREARAIVAAAGIRDGVTDVDLRLAPDGSVSVIEASGRCGATCLPELITLSTGVDVYQQIIKYAFGEPVRFPDAAPSPSIAKLLFSKQGGRVVSVDEKRLDALRSQGAQVVLDVAPGDVVRPVRNGTDRYGHVVMATDDMALFDGFLAEAEACVELR